MECLIPVLEPNYRYAIISSTSHYTKRPHFTCGRFVIWRKNNLHFPSVSSAVGEYVEEAANDGKVFEEVYIIDVHVRNEGCEEGKNDKCGSCYANAEASNQTSASAKLEHKNWPDQE